MQKNAVRPQDKKKVDRGSKEIRKVNELFIRGDRLYEQNNEGNRYRVDNPERNPLPELIKNNLTNQYTEFGGDSCTNQKLQD